MALSDFAMYRHTQVAHLRPYVVGEDLTDVQIAPEDVEAGSPKEGDMIQRDPIDHLATHRLVNATYFRNNFEPA